MGIGPLRLHRNQQLAKNAAADAKAKQSAGPSASAAQAAEQRQAEQRKFEDRADKHRRNGR